MANDKSHKTDMPAGKESIQAPSPKETAFEMTTLGNEDFKDMLAEFDTNGSAPDFNQSAIVLVRKQNNQEEWKELKSKVLSNCHLIPRNRVEQWKAFVLEMRENQRRKYVVALVDFHNVHIRTSISRHLKVHSVSSIDFKPLQPDMFQVLFEEVFHNALKTAKMVSKNHEKTDWGRGKERAWGGAKAAPQKTRTGEGIVEEKQVMNLEDMSGQRLDLSDLEEYYAIVNQLKNGEITEADLDILAFVKFILQDFIVSDSSDLHFHCGPQAGRIRHRFQGDLYTRLSHIPRDKFGQIVNSLCILGGKDPSKMLREPVETVIKLRIRLEDEIKDVEFRFESLQSVPKPSVNLRGQTKPIRDINKIGFLPEQLAIIKQAYAKRTGVNVITGETGSGKTNTMNAICVILEEDDKKVIIEFGSPIEIESDKRVQITIRESAMEKETDKIYATAFKAALRFDPDILFFTEIRNSNEARTALRAANTGHLVFTTMHAADVEEAIARLLDMGLSRDMIAKGINLICAQTLVKKLCTLCKIKDEAVSVMANCSIYTENKRGCDHCTEGFSGRVVIAEVCALNEVQRDWIREGMSPGEIAKKSMVAGYFISLEEAAILKMRMGETTEMEIQDLRAEISDPSTTGHYYYQGRGSASVAIKGHIVEENIVRPDDYVDGIGPNEDVLHENSQNYGEDDNVIDADYEDLDNAEEMSVEENSNGEPNYENESSQAHSR